MGEDGESRRLRPAPFRIVRTPEGVVLKRGATEISILGTGAAAFVETLVAKAACGATRDEICEQFPAPERPFAGQLIDQLLANRLLRETTGAPDEPPEDESHLDIFYWQFGETTRGVTEQLNSGGVVLVGLNAITRQLARSLLETGMTAITVVDDPRLRDERAFGTAGGSQDPLWGLLRSRAVDLGTGGAAGAGSAADAWSATAQAPVGCLVAGSDHGNQQVLLEWNARCVTRGQRFLPVLLQNFVGYVGPVVVPGQTACFDCVRARWNAHIDQTETRGALDDLAVEGQDVIGFHPAMASMLGDLAAFELTRLLGRGLPNRRIGLQIELSLLRPQLTTRRVLKAPRCPTCSPLHTRAQVSPRK